MSKDEKTEFTELNDEYQKCLNQYYDKFFDGKNVNFENICTEQLEKLQSKGSYYKNAFAEYEDFKTKEIKK